MSGGIGEFSVTAGKERASASQRTPAPAAAAAGPIPADAHSHYVVISPTAWPQSGPIRFHNGFLDELKTGFRLAVKVPLPEMPGFFPAGAEGDLELQGKDVLHLGSTLRDQPLFSRLEALRALVQRCAERKAAFPEFIASLNTLGIPSDWRNDIVNGLFETAAAPSAPPAASSAPARADDDLDRILGMIDAPIPGNPPGPGPATPRLASEAPARPARTADGPAANPGLSRFVEEVGRDSTGFTLRESAARGLLRDLTESVAALRSGLLGQPALAGALAFAASLGRLAKLAKGREKQNVHLWSRLPDDPRALLAGDKSGDIRDFVQAVVLLDPARRDDASLLAVSALAADLGAPLLVQLAGDEIPGAAAALKAGPAAGRTYFFSGGVAASVESADGGASGAVVFRPAAFAFLEGLVGAREGLDGFLDKAMILEDQDVLTEKGQGRATDRLLDNAAAEAVRARGINRVNGVRNRAVAVFPPLVRAESGP